MGFKPESLKVIESTVDKGKDAFSWDSLAEQFYASEGSNVKNKGGGEDRTKEIAEIAARTVRSFYPNRDKQWSAAFVNVTPEAKAIEILHIATLFEFERDFTLNHRPYVAPPVKEEKKKEGDGGAPAVPPVPGPPAAGGPPSPPPMPSPPPAPVAVPPPPM